MKSSTLNLPSEIFQHLHRDEVVILDVRTIHEFVGGHVEGAVNIPYDNLDFFLEEIFSWNKPIIVCSSGGRRSQIAASFLNKRGLKAIDGGNWEELHRSIAD